MSYLLDLDSQVSGTAGCAIAQRYIYRLTELGSLIGPLERQHSRGTPLRLLWRYPIHHLPHDDPSALQTRPAPSTSLR